jgi:hypothetical protein
MCGRNSDQRGLFFFIDQQWVCTRQWHLGSCRLHHFTRFKIVAGKRVIRSDKAYYTMCVVIVFLYPFYLILAFVIQLFHLLKYCSLFYCDLVSTSLPLTIVMLPFFVLFTGLVCALWELLVVLGAVVSIIGLCYGFWWFKPAHRN